LRRAHRVTTPRPPGQAAFPSAETALEPAGRDLLEQAVPPGEKRGELVEVGEVDRP
jgi:hypothetical protein